MQRLNDRNVPSESDKIRVFSYPRSKVTAGVVHFGIGNFHRTHQAIYCEDLLCQGETKWGITGVSLRSANVHNALSPQDFLYTQVTLDDEDTYRIVGAIKDVLVAPKDPQAVIEAVADPRTQLVTTTITEKAYYLESGTIDFQHRDLLADLRSLAAPKTVFGYLAAAIVRRYHASAEPLTIMCCDNVRAGGAHLQKGVDTLLSTHCTESQQWATQQVSFISSMVDRISPATDTGLKDQIETSLQLTDEWPVSAEPFSQWIIEDNFRGERPPFDRVGALFVEDISLYEAMKLHVLNSAHSMIAVFGYLCGDQYIHQALQRKEILNFVKDALLCNVLPVLNVPTEWDAIEYVEQVMHRFCSAAIPYRVQQVNTDSSQKIQQRWLVTVDSALQQGQHPDFFAFAFAAWIYHIHSSVQQNDLRDPLEQQLREIVSNNHQMVSNISLLLGSHGAFQFDQHEQFMASVREYHSDFVVHGFPSVLTQFLDHQTNRG